MNAQTMPIQTSSREATQSAIWALLDAPDQSQPPAPTRVMVGTRLAGLSSAGVCKLLKPGISSQTIGPLSDCLGLGKGVVVQCPDLDRSTANRRVTRRQLLPVHSAEGVLRLLELGQMAAYTIETEEKAFAWLHRPHPMR